MNWCPLYVSFPGNKFLEPGQDKDVLRTNQNWLVPGPTLYKIGVKIFLLKHSETQYLSFIVVGNNVRPGGG